MKENVEPILPNSANQFNTVFISYGRQQSLAFARKLYDALLQKGHSAWFDMNDIPLGVDFQDQIDVGIRKADNFIFIISPHSIQSVYCYKELALAVKYNKRIIPIMHVEPQIKEDWEKIDPEIGRRNWVQMKQDFNAAIKLSEQALEIQEGILTTPEADWKHIDSFSESFKDLLQLIESHKTYVHEHTLLLDKAIDWQDKQHSRQMVLVGNERTKAENFLHQSHQPFRNPTGHVINPPCIPTELMAYYVMESKKNGNNLQADLFICHDAEELETVEPIRSALSQHGFSSWISNKDIEKGTEYTQAIHGGVIKSSNLLFFLSRRSLMSAYCQKEYNYALSYNKRIIPVLIDDVSDSEIDENAFPGLAHLQHINFRDLTNEVKIEIQSREDVKADVEARREKTPFEISLNELLNTLNTNSSYHEEHRKFLVQSIRWKDKGEKPSFLLRGFNLENAQSWLRINKGREQYPPHELHNEFITASLAAKGQLGTEVFISYSRKDSDFARLLNEKLQMSGKTTWFDQESISEGVNFENEIFKGIAAADNFLFIVSPDSVASEYCESEVNQAVLLNKRIISIKLRDTDTDSIPEALRLINWIDFEETDFDQSFAKLVNAVEIDRDHARQHTVLQQRASEWLDNNRTHDYLLNAPACEKAEDWIENAGYELPEIPYDLLLKEVREKREKGHKNWFQRIKKKISNSLRNNYVQVALGTYIWFAFWIVGFFYFETIIGERGEDFNVGAIILLFLYLAAIPIWFYYKILPVELEKRKKSAKRFLLNAGKLFLGTIPALVITLAVSNADEALSISEAVPFLAFLWFMGYSYAIFEVWLLISRKRKREHRDKNKVSRKTNVFKRFFRDVYVQTVLLFFLFKMWAGGINTLEAVIILILFYLFELVPARVFSYENYQEIRPDETPKKNKKRIAISVGWIFIGWFLSLLLVPDDVSIGEISTMGIVLIFVDYFTVLLVVYLLLRLKIWMQKKKKKRVYKTDTIAELVGFYRQDGKPKMPMVTKQQIDYIHQSRTGISISKIELKIVQNNLQNRLRVAWGMLVFMIFAGYSIYILSAESNIVKVSYEHNLDHYLSKHVIPNAYDTTYTTLELESLKLLKIPASITVLSGLEELKLNRCELRSIQKEVYYLNGLKKFELQENELSSLPDEFEKLDSLEFLTLSYNKFEEIPKSVCECKNLEKLNFQYNQITTVPGAIGKLKKLKELYLDNNGIAKIPKSIKELNELKLLDLSYNKLWNVPAEIGELSNLEELNLSNNKLGKLPVEIGGLKKLKSLELSENSLEILPSEIGQLTKLEELILSYNNLKTVPPEFYNLKNLKMLEFMGNMLSNEEKVKIKGAFPNCDIYFDE